MSRNHVYPIWGNLLRFGKHIRAIRIKENSCEEMTVTTSAKERILCKYIVKLVC